MLLKKILTSILICSIIENVQGFSKFNKINFQFRVSYIHNLIEKENHTCVDIVEFFLHRSYAYNKKLNAIISYNPRAIDKAKELDNYYNLNKKFIGKLHCIPITVKDNIDVFGMPTTGGLKALKNSFPNKNALVVTRLLSEGAIVISKSNLGELGEGLVKSELGGICRNPFDLKRTCGPSSLGSGAAIASGLAVIGIGTDTDGSVQYPGSCNGLYALRPNHNSSNLEGVIPYFLKQDTIGPFSKYLDDLVLTHSILLNDSNIYLQYLNHEKSLSNLKIGVFKNLFKNFDFDEYYKSFPISYDVDPEIEIQLDMAIEKFKNLGIIVYEYVLDEEKLIYIVKKIIDYIDNLYFCMKSCKKIAFNYYFEDEARFHKDSPVKNFHDLFNSPYLSYFWKKELKECNIKNETESCSNSCLNYDKQREEIINFLNKNFYEKNDIDSILLPTMNQLPNNIETDFIFSIPSLISFAALTGYQSLNIPVGYTEPNSDAPDGLPLGLVLISKPSRSINSFFVAKEYEKKFGLVKLPSNTPLQVNSTTKRQHQKNIYIFTLTIFIFNFNLNFKV